MAREYLTAAIVLGSHKLGDADRIVDLFTRDRGRVPTVVKGIRKVKSRWGGRLEPFTEIEARLHEGRNLHTLTGADTVRTNAVLRDSPPCLVSGLSVIEMVSRSTPELHPKPRTYNLLLRFLDEMNPVCRHAVARDANTAAAPTVLALAAQLKIMLLAGFLPHLFTCSRCGASANLTRFSAAAGGVLCAACHGESFAVTGDTLAAMRFLLEHPLSESNDAGMTGNASREARRCLRELCRFHLGVNLKVDPW
ncbi:MAG: DNA repair protein RecO [Thermoleophilia bacterium]